ncbi:uncharacterized protein LOC129808680 [Phlebotomus papatasi]|uniref:uncharacterized protein LOC129808680 n=1 Tax=Phlebotomus papatasi TaxID=29031 RepID=UPI0024843353|nr:uncharacterized protein LOC129808680 [Phlebotomus papatasi]
MSTVDAVTWLQQMRQNNPRTNSPFQDSLTLDVGASLRICHLNVEGMSKAKSEYLARLMRDERVDIITIQETHTISDENLRSRGSIPGYVLVDAIHSAVHGVATYIKSSIPNYNVVYKDCTDNIHVLAIEVSGVTVINVYKPPSSRWPRVPLKSFSHPAVYVGDFNSHNQAWGYEDSDIDGNLLFEWMTLNNLYLIYSSKSKGTFRSARWQKDYNPDLTIVTKNHDGEVNGAKRSVLSGFPNSQHRPVLLHYGISIPLVESEPKPRWNFRKANWAAFSKDFDHQYIPGWNENCDELYEEYNATNNNKVAARLLTELDDQRKRKWRETVENTDFTHSSRKAWRLLRKLGADSRCEATVNKISPNSVASRLIRVSKTKLSKVDLELTRREVRCKRKTLTESSLSGRFSTADLECALLSVKLGKAAGFDGIYPEFIKNAGPKVKCWLVDLFNRILDTGHLPKLFKRAKVIAILKPGKDGTDAAHYRPISLLVSVVYKLLERMILHRIQPHIDRATPVSQAGFRKHRGCTEQVLALTSHVEAGYERRQKTGVVFVDLTAAYDTVWRDGLFLKFMEVIPCAKLSGLLNNMLSNRYFQVFLGNKSSSWRRLNEGLPQGSVLAPSLFNLYISDTPRTQAKQFQYADDLALAVQSESLTEIEEILESDLSILSTYFRRWRLQPNPAKTEACAFHLNNREAHSKLNVCFEGSTINHVEHPKYLGVTLDRTLTYKPHLEKTAKKTSSRVNLIQKLAGTTWGADAQSLRTATLALVYSAAEYCAPVWHNSAHVHKVDTQLNNAMHLITGTVKSTQLPWLPVLSNIAPPKLRREAAAVREVTNCRENANSLLYTELQELPSRRLKSRRPPWTVDPSITGVDFCLEQKWKEIWSRAAPVNGHLVRDPTSRVPGFDLRRREWAMLNRFRTTQGRCAYLLHKWGMADSPECDCGSAFQTMSHIVNDCPRRGFVGGLGSLDRLPQAAHDYLRNLDLNL